MQSIVTGGMKEKVFEYIMGNGGSMKEADIITELWFSGDSTGVPAQDYKKAKNNLASQITYLRKALKSHAGTVIKENGIITIKFEKPVMPTPELEPGEVVCFGCGVRFETEENDEEPHCLECVNKLMIEFGISFV